MIRFEQAKTYARQHGPGLAVEALVNFVLPLLVYDWIKPGHGDVQALMASSIPPIIWSLVEFVRRRRVDAVSMLVLAGIALSLLAFLGGGSVKLLQLREKLVTVLIGLVFLGSAAIGKPLIYQLARAGLARRSSSELAEFEGIARQPLLQAFDDHHDHGLGFRAGGRGDPCRRPGPSSCPCGPT